MDPPPLQPPRPSRRAPARAVLALLPSALPLLALPALLAATTGEVAVAPRAAVLVGAAVALAVGAGVGGARPRPWLDLPLAAAMGMAAEHLLLFPGLPRAHDTITHLWGIAAVAREVAAGDLLPGWVHGLGFGIPLLQFYGPASFLAPILLVLAGLGPAAALAGAFALYGALGAAGMYAAVASWSGDRRAALVAATAYAFAPYRLLDGHYRAALGESAALALLPLVFLAGLAAVRGGGRRRLAAAAAVFALLLATHPLSAAMAAAALAVAAAVELAAGGGRELLRGGGRLLASGLFAVALAGCFVLPLALELGAVQAGQAMPGTQRQLFAAHAPAPDDLVRRRLWSELRLSEPRGSEPDRTGEEMPLYFGLALLALLPLAAGAGRLPGAAPCLAQRAPRLPAGLLAVLILALLLALHPVAAWLSALVPLVAVLQFPWRTLGLATFAAAAGAGFAAARLLAAWPDRRWAAVVPGALGALLILDAAPYSGAADWFPPYQGLARVHWPDPECGQRPGCLRIEHIAPPYPLRVAGYFLPPDEPAARPSLFCCAYPEYLTPAAWRASFPPRDPAVLARAGVGLAAWETGAIERLRPRPYAARHGGGGPPRPLPFRRAGGTIDVRLDGKPGTVVVLEQHFPGWQVLTPDGWRAARRSPRGLLQVRVAAGQRALRLRFSGGRDRTAGWLLSAAALLGLTWAVAAPRGAGRRAAPWPRRG